MNSYINDYLSEIHKFKNYIPCVPVTYSAIHLSVIPFDIYYYQ